MGLADDLLAPAEAKGGGCCSVKTLLAFLTDTDPDARDALLAVMAQPFTIMPSTVIARRLTEAGYTIHHASLQRHRRKDCACRT